MRFRRLTPIALAVALASSAAADPVPDQSQPLADDAIDLVGPPIWQTFTAAVTGELATLELRVTPPCAECSADQVLLVGVTETVAGIPPGTHLGDRLVRGAGTGPFPATLSLDFTAQSVFLEAGRVYAIRLSAPNATWQIEAKADTDSYAGGAVFTDPTPDGIVTPDTSVYPGWDVAFATTVTPLACGDGLRMAPAEACDDGNTTAGDGCSAACALEKSGLACQVAIAKAGEAYAAARLRAFQRCRSLALAGRLTVEPEECDGEATVAAAVDKARAKLRRTIAGGRRPACSDGLVAILQLCADDVDDLVGSEGPGRCLVDELDQWTAEQLRSLWGF